MTSTLTADLEFFAAAERYMSMRAIKATPGALTARYIRKNTEESYEQYIRSLRLFFGGQRLASIHAGHLAAYQQARVCGAEPFIRKRRPQDKEAKSSPVKPKKVNQELGFLQTLMRRANCWNAELQDLYQPLLDDEEEIPRALSPEEQRLWLDTSRIKGQWNVVYFYSIMAFGTCMSTDEIRGLRLGDINLYQRVVTVKRKTAKNKERARTIELVGADVLWAIEKLVDRARELGAVDFAHFLFPWRVKIGVYDPLQSMSESGIKVAWNEVRQASGLKWFRQYDCRHTAITRLAESGVPTDVIMSRAGHVSEKMRRHYTHISQSAQRRWLEHAESYHQAPRMQPQSQPFEPRYRRA